MRQISRVDLGLIVLFLSFGVISTTQAQTSPRQKQDTQQTQPATKTLPIQKAAAKDPPAADDGKNANTERRPAFHRQEIPPELEEILKRWETESAKIKTLHGKQTRSEYNTVFKVEKKTAGDFFFETPDKGRIDMLVVPIKKGETSRKTDKEKVPYALELGDTQRWICTGDSVLQINDAAKTYQKAQIPEDQRGKNIVHTPLPFLFGMKAAEAKSRFNLTLQKDNENIAVIIVEPLMEKDLQNYRKAMIMLDKKTYLPSKVYLYQDEGIETLYVFEDVDVNPRGPLWPKLWGNDPYHPNLKGYILFIPPDDPADVQPVKAVGGTKDVKKNTGDNPAMAPQKRPSQSANAPKTNSATK